MSERATRTVERLLPDPGPTSVEQQMDSYNPVESAHEDRPFVAVNFAVSLDGRITVDGRSAGIGSEIDAALLMRLRTRFDAVMIGAGTLKAERYGRIVPNPQLRARRERIGLPHDPLAVIVSASLDLPWDAPLFTCGGGRVLIFTTSDRQPPETATSLRTVRLKPAPVPEGSEEAAARPGGEPRLTEGVDMEEALAYLRRERGIRALLCEGGPTLHSQLQASGSVDDLFLTFGPLLTGGGAPRVLEGQLPDARQAELLWLLRHESELMARYRL